MNEYKGYFINVVHSPDEDGYYAETCNRAGRTVHTTRLFATPTRAQHTAKEFVDNQKEQA